jgi:cytochrome c
MSSFEWNQIIGAVLGSMILAMVSGIIARNLVKPKRLDHPAYAVAVTEPSKSPAAAGNAQAGPEPIEPLLVTADASAGKERAKVCIACHTFDKGGANKIGPNLYNVLGEPIATDRNGYAFSPALQAHKGEKWTLDDLNKWLYDPKGFAAGTKMAGFAGLKNAQDRANVVAYLNTLSDAPKPLGK